MLFFINILWSVYLLNMSYKLVRPTISSKKTFRHLTSKISYLRSPSRTDYRVNQTATSETIKVKHGVTHGSRNESEVPTPKNKKVLKYKRLLPTGFGDRISVYLSVTAAAATVGADVYVYWHDNPSGPTAPRTPQTRPSSPPPARPALTASSPSAAAARRASTAAGAP